MLGFHGISVTPISALEDVPFGRTGPAQGPSNPQRRDWLNSFVALNLLVTTLAPGAPVQAPLNTYDMGLPRVAARALSLSTHLVSTDLGNLQPSVNPFLPRQWPLVPAAPRAWSLNTHLEPTDLLTLRPEVNPFRTPDLTLPAKPRPAGVSHLNETDLNVLRPDVGPFTQANWQLPKVGAKPVPDTPQSGLLQTTLQIVLQDPFVSKLWPLPQAPARGAVSHLVSTDLGNLRPDVTPFIKTDWQSPKATARQAESLSGNLLQTTLDVIVVQAPFAQTDWPAPKVTARAINALGINLLQTTLDTVAVQAPFAQFDWALPKTARAPDFSSTSLDLLQTTLVPDIPVVEPVVTGGGETRPVSDSKLRRLARQERREIHRITGRKGSAIKVVIHADEPKPNDTSASAVSTKESSPRASLTAPLFTPGQIAALKRGISDQDIAHEADRTRLEDAARTRAERQKFRAEAKRLRAEEDELMIVLALMD